MTGDTADFRKRVTLAYALVALLLFVLSAPSIAALRFPDPDDSCVSRRCAICLAVKAGSM